ncbi:MULTISPECIES: serine/threonine-protein kinase [unclassified Mycobacterium]|uniref:serine/threonine-protein kinase n=1 Tax=Mycobacterium sp. TY814 TaxID=3050580 RepID=UPI0027424BE4|nr:MULTISPECIES: serine/threonine-protein kinase [unclassified Mycobacterium]MDP7706716.1 serine/threonine-protein kinase [Mycobacterium sp. TY815]MDP7726479.1 serine/threonine-protein kinase [Mycobacterium sp. TY814]
MIGSLHREPGVGLNTGDVFAGYTIDRLLGRGGMGEVYLAQHPRLPRREALKILNDDISADDAYRQRFIREADLAAALWHPNIVRINDRGEFDGQLWISMDYVDGTDAASLLQDQYPAGMPADKAAAIVEAIATALDYAHLHHDVLHRDVGPANILLADPGTSEQRILLGDFGIARAIGDIGGLTATNMMIGTFPYAAPEQLTDEPIDGRADQYALAATAFHLLTGTTLFPHTNPAVVISRHLSAPPPKLAEIRPALQAFDPVFAIALAKDPSERFARCTHFAEAFTRAMHSTGQPTNSVWTMPRPIAVRTPAPAAPKATETAEPQRRRRRIFAAAATAIALAGVGASSYQSDDAAAPVASPAGVQPQVAAEPAPAQPEAAPAQPQAAPAQPVTAPAPPNDAPPPPAPVAPRASTPAAAPAAQVPKAPAPQAPVPKVPPPPQRPPDPDQAFVNMVSGIPGLTVTDPATAAATGRAVCTSLQNGGTPNDSVQATVNGNNTVTPAQAAAGINAAITVYCPQFQQ